MSESGSREVEKSGSGPEGSDSPTPRLPDSPTTDPPVMLELRNVSVSYGGIQALRDINLTVHAGEIVTLIGANGAGKSTTLRTISRLLNPRAGQIIYAGQDITHIRPDAAVRRGIAQCPEGRRMLARFSVLDNLEMGAYTRNDRPQIRQDLERQFALFPILGERRKQLAGTLSGGSSRCSRLPGHS